MGEKNNIDLEFPNAIAANKIITAVLKYKAPEDLAIKDWAESLNLAHAGEAIKGFVKQGIGKADNFLNRASNKTVSGKTDKIEDVHEEKVATTNYVSEKNIDTSEKPGNGIQHFYSRTQDLGNALRSKYTQWMANQKENLAKNLENTEAFKRSSNNDKSSIQTSAAKVTIGGIRGLKSLLLNLENTKASKRSFNNDKRSIQTSAANVTIEGIRGLKSLLNLATTSAEKQIATLHQNINLKKEPSIEGR